jgi:hypothetical protein
VEIVLSPNLEVLGASIRLDPAMIRRV